MKLFSSDKVACFRSGPFQVSLYNFTTREYAKFLKCSHSTAFTKLKSLEKIGEVELIKAGNRSFWKAWKVNAASEKVLDEVYGNQYIVEHDDPCVVSIEDITDAPFEKYILHV